MHENDAPAIAPAKRRTPTEVDAHKADRVTCGTPPPRAAAEDAAGSPATIDSLGCVRRSEILIERLRSMAKEGGFPRLLPTVRQRPARTVAPARPLAARPAPVRRSSPFAARASDAGESRTDASPRGVLRTDTARRPSVGTESLEKGSFEGLAGVSIAMRRLNVAAAAYPLVPPEEVTGAQMARYAQLIYEKTGIRVSPQKKMLLSNRLRRRLRRTGIGGFDAYYRHLQGLPSSDPEWNAFFQEITTHETYLFRDDKQWKWFAEECLPRLASQRQPRRKPAELRIWSAACSTGDEVYTIAACVAGGLANPKAWNIDILGTDIAIGEIARAQQPGYSQRAMRLTPREYLRFFDWSDRSETWSPKAVLRRMVRFRHHNLMDPLPERPFDVVFLKNVLIYFDPDSKKRVLQNIAPLVKPGGFLVAGAAEGVASLVRGFKRIEPWLFERHERHESNP